MQLHAVLVPPPDVVDDALEAARAMLAPPDDAATSRRGILDRFRGRRQADASAVDLALARPEAVFVRLAKFGNVAATDAAVLARAIEALSHAWPAPLVHVTAMSVAHEPPLDVSAELGGELDALRDIFRNVNEVAQSQRFFLDRRSFRPELVLGSVVVPDDGQVPDAVAGADWPHAGPRWSPSHVTLLRTSFVEGGTSFAEVARIALAGRTDA
jgi:2'-5' RNA ligase